MSLEDDLRYEREAYEAVYRAIRENAWAFRYVYPTGDGEGGGLLEMIRRELSISHSRSAPAYQKEKISNKLRKQVFERDAYRCRHCDTHIDLCVDHIFPESKGGDLSLDNLQTLCRSCNSKKGTKV